MRLALILCLLGGTVGCVDPAPADTTDATAPDDPQSPTTEPAPAEPESEAEPDAPCLPPDCGPTSPDDYDLEVPASFIDTIIVETDRSQGRDVDGDGDIDNALGAMLTSLDGVFGGRDLNEELALAIDEGLLTVGVAWPTLDGGVADDDSLEFHVFLLEDADKDPASRDAYVVTRDSFLPDSGTPKVRFEHGTLDDGVFTAGPADFSIFVPVLGLSIPVTVSQAQLQGELGLDGIGVEGSGITVAGAVSAQRIFEGLNTVLQSPLCSCLGLDTPLVDLDLLPGPDACVAEIDATACEGTPQEVCGIIAGACRLAVPTVGIQADIDLDGDTIPDAISVFMYLQMSGTRLVGVTR